MVNKKYFLIIGIILIAAIIVFTFLNPKVTVNTILVDDFENLIQSEEVFVINTHTPYVGEIEDTDLIAEQWDNMIIYKDQLPQDKNTPIAVYCRSGNMAETSTAQLIDMGYKNVYNLEGGMKAWESSGKELEIKEIKEFEIIAKQWSFEPSIIEVNKGDRVKLNLESVDVAHGFALFDFEVIEFLEPGKTTKVEFIANKVGEFDFFCNVYCGKEHGSMGGKLIVNEN